MLLRRHIANPSYMPKGKTGRSSSGRRKRARRARCEDEDVDGYDSADDGGFQHDDDDDGSECMECDD